MKSFWQYMFSPRLYKIYRDGPLESLYQPHGLEKWGDKFITTANTILNITLYTSPFICMYIYKRGFFSSDETQSITRFLCGISCLTVFCFIIRGIGRASNPKYVAFMKDLMISETNAKLHIETVRKYDFEFYAWPVTFSVAPKQCSKWLKIPFTKSANPELPFYQRSFIQLLAFLATHTFGIRLIYPGSLSLVNNLLWTSLFQGRSTFVETFEGKRTKLGTADGNYIDTMFVDNREQSVLGKILVICSEGNSGFYEIGIMGTPVKAGYSALGWNHPGFAGSTGIPFPSQEQNAIDAVMQFAINELGFQPDDIVMFGWSIGGYTSAWASINYPVKALILDATFDDLLPLAENQMPSAWRLLVKEVVRSYVDLNIAELVTQYPGHVRLVRRTLDEIICLRQGVMSTNRGNHLLLKLIESRHPEATRAGPSDGGVSPVEKYVSLLDAQRSSLIRSGELSDRDRASLRLIGVYLIDYKSTHCTPLPERVFEDIMNSITTIK